MQIISLFPDGPPKGKVLLSYILDGFLLASQDEIPKTHSNIWQSVQIAKIFLELGYAVDAIHYSNHNFIPKDDYSFAIDVRHNLARLSKYLNRDCIKIMHIDSAHILFHDKAELKRLLDLQQRRGITLRPNRYEIPNYCIEHADFATTTGNDFTIGTYRYSGKKIFKLPIPCGIEVEMLDRDVEQCKKQFLWFSSSGPVHKGLDLALEAFRELPEYNLIICGPFEKHKEFVELYHEELYETENIKVVGWVDIDSSKFIKIAQSCCAVLHLSCSEGGASSVKMCLHTGLIPIVSWESSVDVEDFGYLLYDCSVENVKKVITQVASLSNTDMENKWRKTWQYARMHHTRENFTRKYRQINNKIVSIRQKDSDIK